MARMIGVRDCAHARINELPLVYAAVGAAGSWACGHLILACGESLMIGSRDVWGNRVFDPNGMVTSDQTVTIVLLALGYGPMIGEQPGYTWPQS